MKQTVNKKGQFYILISIILITYLFAVLPKTSAKIDNTNTFSQLYTSFMTESALVVNSGIYANNLTTHYNNFSSTYIKYARSKSSDFGYAYALRDQEEITIGNSLNEALNITTPDQSFILGNGAYTTINRTANITFVLQGRQYRFGFTKDPELKVLFMSTMEKERLIHVNE